MAGTLHYITLHYTRVVARDEEAVARARERRRLLLHHDRHARALAEDGGSFRTVMTVMTVMTAIAAARRPRRRAAARVARAVAAELPLAEVVDADRLGRRVASVPS